MRLNKAVSTVTNITTNLEINLPRNVEFVGGDLERVDVEIAVAENRAVGGGVEYLVVVVPFQHCFGNGSDGDVAGEVKLFGVVVNQFSMLSRMKKLPCIVNNQTEIRESLTVFNPFQSYSRNGQSNQFA